MNRAGFALITVLWLVTLLTAIVGAAAFAAKTGQAASVNRMALARARWAAEACLNIVHARWRMGGLADSRSVRLGVELGCDWTVRDPTTRLNLNHADSTTLHALADRVGADYATAAVWVAAVIAERDARPFTNLSEAAALPGFDSALTPFVTVDGPGTVNTLQAPVEVLSAIPGLTSEALNVLVRRRSSGDPIIGIDMLSGEISAASRQILSQYYRELRSTLAFERTELLLDLRGRDATYGPELEVVLEVLVRTLPKRLAIIRRRMR